MIAPYEQLDRRFAEIGPLAERAARPSRGWIRAVRDALGMTTAQLGKRIGVTQPRIIEMEKSEIAGTITLHNLERAAEAMGCRVVYTFLPVQPLKQTVEGRAIKLAEEQLAAVEQTMQLEDQSVHDPRGRKTVLDLMARQLLKRPARLWDKP